MCLMLVLCSLLMRLISFLGMSFGLLVFLMYRLFCSVLFGLIVLFVYVVVC